MGDARTTERDVRYDVIRVVCMLFVIALHTGLSFRTNDVSRAVIYTVLFVCNPLFYMISGVLNLRKSFCSKGDYKKYYWGKFVSILLPYVFATFLLNLWNICADGTWNGMELYIKTTYAAFMNRNKSIHLWFMYPLAGMLLSAPFMAKMLRNMSDWELNLLLFLAIAWNVVKIHLAQDVDIEFAYSGWLLPDWVIWFFAGYYCNRVINNADKKKTYILLLWGGVCGGIVTVLGQVLLSGHYNHATEYAPAYIIFVMAVFVFMEKINIQSQAFKKVITFLAKHSFMIYLLHWNVIRITAKIMDGYAPNIYRYLVSIVITFIMSTALSVTLDLLIIGPLQKLLNKVFYKYFYVLG